MKNLIALMTVLLLSSGAFASNKIIAQFDFAKDRVSGMDSSYTKVRVQLTEEGTLFVSTWEGLSGYIFAGAENNMDATIEVRDLSEAQFSLIKRDVFQLSRAKIKTTRAQVVCMMMPSPGMGIDSLMVARKYDYNTNEFNGSLELVDGPSGCWISSQTHPESNYDRESAKVLKRSLKLLSL